MESGSAKLVVLKSLRPLTRGPLPLQIGALRRAILRFARTFGEPAIGIAEHKLPRPGVNHPPDQRSPMAEALNWVSRITSVSILMVLPGVVGYWVDAKLKTTVLFTLLGFGLGMFAGIWQLIKETGLKPSSRTQPGPNQNAERSPGGHDRDQRESGGGDKA